MTLAKGKVESGVGHAQKTPLKGLRFESLAEAQTYLDHWEARWADTRIHGTTKRQVAVMFAEERPTLLPLPVEPFRYYQYGERTVHLDGCVEVEAAYYGAPPGWIGRRVQVQWDARQVRLMNPLTGQLLREHLRQARGGHRIKDEDRPNKTPLGTLRLLDRAGKAGSQIGALCRGMHQAQGQTAVRRILGVLSLAKKYGAPSVDDACAAALEVGVGEYRFVRRYLERNPQLPLGLRQVDPLIRNRLLCPGQFMRARRSCRDNIFSLVTAVRLSRRASDRFPGSRSRPGRGTWRRRLHQYQCPGRACRWNTCSLS